MNEKQRESRQGWYETFGLVIGALIAIVVLFTLVARLEWVDGSSMYPTLKDREMMLVWRAGYTPKPGDVVLLTQKSYREASLVKRVIAVGGQTVRIDYEENKVYVDEAALDEPYLNREEADPMEKRPADWTEELTVPEGCVFVMGDNRNHSSDSRDPAIDVVAAANVMGKCVLALVPFRTL